MPEPMKPAHARKVANSPFTLLGASLETLLEAVERLQNTRRPQPGDDVLIAKIKAAIVRRFKGES